MHITQTFILRLFVDLEAPEMLRGSLQAITGKEACTFTNEQALLVLLRQMTRPTPEIEITPTQKGMADEG
jgi:hypothetical protein